MSNPCSICPPAQDCIFPADLELYGLQGPNGPWSWLAPNAYRDVWVECPPGWDCPPRSVGRWERVYGRDIPTLSPPTSSPMYLRLRCCLNDIISPVPAGITKAELNALAMRMLNACAKQQAFCIRQAKVSTALRPAFGQRKPKTLFLGDLNQDVACLGQAFSATVPVKFKPPPGNFPPFTINVISGSLPPGFNDAENIQGTAWVVSGIATQVGTYPFTLRVQESDPGNQNDTKPFELEIFGISNGLVDKLGFITLATADACQDYGLQLATYGGVVPITFEYLGHPFNPPPWLSMTQGGFISGVPLQAHAGNTYYFNVRLTDWVGRKCIQNCKISVNTFTCPTVGNPPSGRMGDPYVYQFTVAFGTGPMDYHFGAGTMPPGLTITDAGFLIGTPEVPGTYVFSIVVHDSKGCGCQLPLTMLIEGAEFTNTPPAIATQCSAYNLTGFQMTAAPAGMVFSGSMPTGMSISPTGFISGIPTVQGAKTMNITAVLPGMPSATVNQSFPVVISSAGDTFISGGHTYNKAHDLSDFTWLDNVGQYHIAPVNMDNATFNLGASGVEVVFQRSGSGGAGAFALLAASCNCGTAAWSISGVLEWTFSHPASGDVVNMSADVWGGVLSSPGIKSTDGSASVGPIVGVACPGTNICQFFVTSIQCAAGHTITLKLTVT